MSRGRHEIGWDIDYSMKFGRAVLEWRPEQFEKWCKAFDWLVSGPMIEPDEAAAFASKFVSFDPIPRLRDLKRGTSLAEDNLNLTGFDAVQFAMSELKKA